MTTITGTARSSPSWRREARRASIAPRDPHHRPFHGHRARRRLSRQQPGAPFGRRAHAHRYRRDARSACSRSGSRGGPRRARMSFGYYRAEILGALVSGLMIWLIAGGLVYEAILRLREPPEVEGRHRVHRRDDRLARQPRQRADASGARRRQHERPGRVHAHALRRDRKRRRDHRRRRALLTHWRPIDPIVTIFFSVLMLYSSWGLVTEAVGVLMESTPRGTDRGQAVHADLAALPGVRRGARSAHLDGFDRAPGPQRPSRRDRRVRSASSSRPTRSSTPSHRIGHTTIQVEHPDRFRSDRCYDCAGH